MARYTGPNCKMCRREGCKLYLKGERCTNGKCAFDHRSTAPGQHGAANKKVREYGMHLREKQKVKKYYGMLETQFANLYAEAERKPGMTGENLLVLLERRLDNVVYRLGFAASRKEARQLVLHAHFQLNGKKVNVPSYEVRKGDVIALKDSSRKLEKFKVLIENITARTVPAWMNVDKENIVATITELPTREYVVFPFEEDLIVELYSK